MSIQLAWTDVANEDSYQVWKSERFPNAGAWSAIAALAANENSYIDTDVVSGRTYKYKIASVAGAAKTFGNSAEVYYSNRARDLLADETDGLSISFVDDNMSVKDSSGSDTETSILGGGVTRTGTKKIIRGASGLLGYQPSNVLVDVDTDDASTWVAVNGGTWTPIETTNGRFTQGSDTSARGQWVGSGVQFEADQPRNFRCRIKKVAGSDWVLITQYNSSFGAVNRVRAWFNLATQTPGTNEIDGTGVFISSSVSAPDADGYMTIDFSCTISVTSSGVGIWGVTGDGSGTRDTTGCIYDISQPMHGFAPVVTGYIASDYLGSAVFALPFDHAVGSTTSAPLPLGVLNEPAATNLFKHSNFFEYNAGANDGWAGDPGNTRTPNSGISPSGENDAWELNTSTGTIQQIKSGGPIIGPYDGTITLWAKAGGSNPATHLRITTNNGIAWNTGLSVKHTLTSEWVRVELSGVLVSSGTDCAVILGSAFVEGGTDNDCLGTCLIWQAQLEAGLVATSPIVTGANEETRDPDQMNANAILPGWWITPAFLTGYCDFIITDGDQLANNCIIGVAFSHNLGGRVLNGTGANKYDLWAAPGNGWRLADEVDPGEYRNAIGCENGSNVGAGSSVNGAPGENFQAVPNVMTWAQLNIGYQTNTTTIFRGHIKELMVLPRQMDQADLNTLTTPDP